MKTCKVFKQCGSCSLLNLEYEKQLIKKQNYCKDLLRSVGLKAIEVHSTLGQSNPYHYRNKVIVAYNQEGKAGFYEENSHKIIPYASCLLHDAETDGIIKKIGSMLKHYRIKRYNEDRGTGFLRHVLIRRGFVTNQTMVVLVVSSFVFPGSKQFVKELTTAFKSIRTIVLNKNTRKTSVVLGNDEKVLYGKGFITDFLCGLEFKISPKSFYQINHEQCEALYQKAYDLLGLTGKETVIDAYCGIGTIGMIAADKAKKVIGVELNKDAIKDAKHNATHNKVNNISFVCADATDYMLDLAKRQEAIDIVILDPPRQGTTKEFIKAVKTLGAKKVLYISCDPKTQVRDILEFKKAGYMTHALFPVDLFPMTNHTESIVMLEKR